MESTDNAPRVPFWSIIENELSRNYQFVDFQVDSLRILKNEVAISQNVECDAPSCFVSRRHHRPKANRNGVEMDSLFFVDDKEDDDGRRGVVVQQTLDSLHQFLCHRVHVDLNYLATETEANGGDVGYDEDRMVMALNQKLSEMAVAGRMTGR